MRVGNQGARPNMRKQVDQICVENRWDAHRPVDGMLMPELGMLLKALKRSKLLSPPRVAGRHPRPQTMLQDGVDLVGHASKHLANRQCRATQDHLDERCTLEEKREIGTESFDHWLPLSGLALTQLPGWGKVAAVYALRNASNKDDRRPH